MLKAFLNPPLQQNVMKKIALNFHFVHLSSKQQTKNIFHDKILTNLDCFVCFACIFSNPQAIPNLFEYLDLQRKFSRAFLGIFFNFYFPWNIFFQKKNSVFTSTSLHHNSRHMAEFFDIIFLSFSAHIRKYRHSLVSLEIHDDKSTSVSIIANISNNLSSKEWNLKDTAQL